MIFIGLGSNLASANGHSPAQNLGNALTCLEIRGITVLHTSRLHETAPLPADGAPWYVNAVAEVSAELS
ncbi:MAG: 2-amino-4-hydroxy-6-hydroxymethyldihydropteridine diphosphokinase, partial [Rhodospirillales bacterium]|nr:2-amino-4-hydroxy-6-hydroxymethyldihydropteridine diphosphokinase [Rhodospirillales bacterium]